MHIDLGPARSWGEPFAARATPFVPEVAAREVLADSRTLKGGGAAGIATVGAAGVEVAQEFWRKPSRPSCLRCPISTPFAGCSSPWR